MENITKLGLKYKKIQKYNDNFMSKVLLDNNMFRVKIDNLNIHKNLYQRNNIVYLELSFDKDDIDYIVEDNPLKQGLTVPGVRIPIVNKEYLDNNLPDHIIILAWKMGVVIL